MPKRKSDTNKENEDPILKLRKTSSPPPPNKETIIDENNNEVVVAKTSNEEQLESVNIENEFVKLNSYLRKAKKSGDYSIEGVANELPCTLGLEVEGFGPISLPLIDPQASKLIERCEQAPYGKDFETLVDRKVRDSFQLEPSQFKIRNPNWQKKLDELLERVAKGLGCQQKIEGKLYKLLVYKEGGHFLKHRDTEKENGMFGTLIIQPPSIHKGGELVVYENNGRSKKEIDFCAKDGNSEFAVHFAAHFADLEHEILEIKSGYRIAIIYSLCWSDATIEGSVISNGELTDEVFESLGKLDSKLFKLGMILEHQYTVQSLRENGVRAFKGLDKDRFNLLYEANRRLAEEQQISFHICHARLVVSSYDWNEYKGRYHDTIFGVIYDDDNPDSDSYNWIEDERKMRLAEWYNVDGKRVFGKTKIELSFFDGLYEPGSDNDTQVDLKNEDEWGEFIGRDFESYSGNAGATMTTEYSKYLLVIWPKRHDYQITLKLDLNSSLNPLYEEICVNKQETSSDNKVEVEVEINQQLEGKFAQLLGYIKANQTTLTCVQTTQVMEIIQKLNKQEHAKMLFTELDATYQAANFGEVAKLIAKFGFDALKDGLKRFSNMSLENFWRNCFIAETFHQVDQNVSREYFLEFILPFIEDANNLEKLICLAKKEPFRLRNPHVFRVEDLRGKDHMILVLLKTLKLFESEQTARVFETIKEKLNHHMKEDTHLNNLIAEITKEQNKMFKDCRPIIELYEERKKWLLSKLEAQPQFSWRMPKADFIDDNDILIFLQSDRNELVYKFTNKYHWESSFESLTKNNLWRGFSVIVGRMPKNTLRITKTREWFNSYLEEFKKPLIKELQLIDFFLKPN